MKVNVLIRILSFQFARLNRRGRLQQAGQLFVGTKSYFFDYSIGAK